MKSDPDSTVKSMIDRFWQVLMFGLPKRWLSRLFGRVARTPWSKYLIPFYIKMYRIDTTDLAKSVSAYDNLQEFFTRRLKPGVRPIDVRVNYIVSPVDGKVSQVGTIEGNCLLQVKGQPYTVEELLNGDADKASRFMNGHYITLYLSPKNYHHIHAPVSGYVEEMQYCPGTLYPVNELAVRLVRHLYVKNERIVTTMRTRFGPLAIVKVGAMNVGSIKVHYDERVCTNNVGTKRCRMRYSPSVFIQKGEEIGQFEFGSTVILLAPPNTLDFLPEIKPGTPVRVGEAIGRILPTGEEE